jgi:hypothetical protein
MKRSLIALAALAISTTLAHTQDAPKQPLTVYECLSIFSGLNSLNWVGQQLDEPPATKPAGAASYKLGDARWTLATDINALKSVYQTAHDAQDGFLRELPALPPAKDNQNSPERVDAAQAQNKAATGNWDSINKKPCSVVPGHFKDTDLKVGDGPDQNPIPPSVLGALIPIIDRGK